MIVRVPARGRYALRAMVELARDRSGRPLKSAEIARRQAIPVRYLELILKSLKHAGHLDSRRGNEGGYWLAAAPDSLTVAAVLQAVDGPLWADEEVEGATPRTGSTAEAAEALEVVWQRAYEAVLGVLAGTSLADLVRLYDSALLRATADWVI